MNPLWNNQSRTKKNIRKKRTKPTKDYSGNVNTHFRRGNKRGTNDFATLLRTNSSR